MQIYLAMERALLVVSRRNGVWQTTSRLVGLQPTSLAIDPFQPERVYCGTFGKGLWRSLDAGHTWYPIGDAGTHIDFWQGDGIAHPRITAVAVSPLEQSGGCGVVYVGTEPSALFRSDDGGENWHELKGFHELPSAPTWFFPSRPYTHHIRWITPDLHVAGRLYVSVEIGGIMRSLDGGEHWEDRNPTGPFDTHKLLMHPLAPNRLYAATAGEMGGQAGPPQGFLGLMSTAVGFREGEVGRQMLANIATLSRLAGKLSGYNESYDGGETWQGADSGLPEHETYLWSIALDPADPNTMLVAASSDAFQAHFDRGRGGSSAIFRRTCGEPWQKVPQGLPSEMGTAISALTSHNAEPGVFYALNNQGFYRSSDTGISWERLPIPWDASYVYQHHQALVVSDL